MVEIRKTSVLFFPFDLFGGGGSAAGTELLADAFKELLDDIESETKPTRAIAYQPHVTTREFSFREMSAYEHWRQTAQDVIRDVLKRGDRLFWITGNHLGALPLYEILVECVPDILIIQFDAHLDIYNLRDCTEELSHGNFLMYARRPLPRIINIGHRELLLTPSHISQFYYRTYAASQIASNILDVREQLRKEIDTAPAVFVDIDCDVLDPAFFPAVAQSHPFGLSTHQLLTFLDIVPPNHLAGLSISEFHPTRDQHDRSLETLMWLIEHTLLRLYESKM